MSTQSYYTIRQRDPLRVPSSFNEQERSLVIQIERTFDDVYKKFGRLGMDDMSGEFRFVIDNKYDKISGITITEDGVNISGSKYVNIQSGDDEWTFDSNGLKYQDDNSPIPFEIRNYDEKDNLANGVFTKCEQGSGEIVLVALCPQSFHTSPSGYWRGELIFEMTDQQDTVDENGYTVSGRRSVLITLTENGDIGAPANPWQRIISKYYQGHYVGPHSQMNICPNPYKPYTGITFVENVIDGEEVITLNSLTTIDKFQINVDKITAGDVYGSFYGPLIDSNGSLFVYPRGTANKYIKFEEYTYNNVDYTKIWSNGTLVVEGDLTGNVTGDVTGNVTGNLTGTVNKKTTSQTSFNNITDPGTYALSSLSGMSDKPSNISAGSALLEVESTQYEVWQRLAFEESIYIRHKYINTWGSWYRLRGFTGAPTYGQLSGRA